MCIDSGTAISLAEANIRGVYAAVSRDHCVRLHAESTGYNRALLDCGVIEMTHWEQLFKKTNNALVNWVRPIAVWVEMPGWQPDDYKKSP